MQENTRDIVLFDPFQADVPFLHLLGNHKFSDVSWGIPANIYLFKVNNRNTRERCEIRSKLTLKTPERVNDVNILP